MAKRKTTKSITLPDPTLHESNGHHTADRLTEGDRKDLWIAGLEAQVAINEANRAAEIAREKDAAFKRLAMALLGKYAATGVNPSTGDLTRELPAEAKG